jgi:hypothetical protein
MLKREQCLALKTDKERAKAIPQMSVYDWDIVADWESETEDKDYKDAFHCASRSMYHRMELREDAL